MRLLTYILICASICFRSLPLMGASRDSVSLYESYAERSDVMKQQIARPFLNPALQRYRHTNSLTEVHLGYDLQNNQSNALQVGDERIDYAINPESYLHLAKNAVVWGNALYQNSLQKNVKANSVADFDMLYPYITADSVGGNVNSEIYSFEGGYSGLYKQFSYGVEMKYRSELLYKKVDPRPRSIVSDLDINLGGSLRANDNYAYGLSLNYGHYSQSGSILFFDPLGQTAIFHLSGLGMDYVRFAGTNTSYYYVGDNVGMSFSVLPINDGIMSGNISYLYSKTTKELSGFNHLPLTELNAHELAFEFTSMLVENQKHQLNLKLDAQFEHKSGVENIFGGEANQYQQIASSKMFASDDLNAKLSVLYNVRLAPEWDFYVKPSVLFHNYNSQYMNVNHSMGFTNLVAQLSIGTQFQKSKKNYTIVAFDVAHSANGTKNIHQSDNAGRDYFKEIDRINLQHLTNDFYALGLNVRSHFFSHKFPKIGFYIAANGAYRAYLDGKNAYGINASVGMIF